MRHRNIRNICKAINHGNTEQAIKLIDKTRNLDLYTHPIIFDKLFIILDADVLTNPLITTADKRNIDVVKRLLEKGANPNIHLEDRWSPLEVTHARKYPQSL